MEKNQGQVINQGGTSLQISEPVKAMVKAVVHVNMILPFKLDNQELVMWSDSVVDLVPEATPQKIKFLLDLFKMDELEWDRSKGIQNIFTGLKFIYEEEGKYVFKKPR